MKQAILMRKTRDRSRRAQHLYRLTEPHKGHDWLLLSSSNTQANRWLVHHSHTDDMVRGWYWVDSRAGTSAEVLAKLGYQEIVP